MRCVRYANSLYRLIQIQAGTGASNVGMAWGISELALVCRGHEKSHQSNAIGGRAHVVVLIFPL